MGNSLPCWEVSFMKSFCRSLFENYSEKNPYKIAANERETEKLLKNIEYETVIYNANRGDWGSISCWTGWNNFVLTYQTDTATNITRFFLPSNPTELAGCFKTEQNRIIIQYYFRKEEKFHRKYRIFYTIIIAFLGIFWFFIIGDAAAGHFITGKDWIELILITAVFIGAYLSGISIPKSHRELLTGILKKAAEQPENQNRDFHVNT